MPIKDYKPADTYEPLRKQFNSLKMLAVSQESQLTVLRNKDYSLAESKLSKLESSLDSEKQMNAELTSEIESLRDKQKWISVEDKLPDTGRVIAIGNGCESEIVVFLAFVKGGGKFKAKGRDCTELVTHWMPLPEPLKEQGE